MMIKCMILTFLFYDFVHLHSYDDTKRLKETLFDGSRYRTDVKPVENQSQSVKVNISSTLKAFAEVNVPDGYAVLVLELEMTWKDEYLIWNAIEFNGIETINLQKGSFWTPAIKIINQMEDKCVNVIEEVYTPEWVSKDGKVTIYQTNTVKVKCNSDVSFYPFDFHTCLIAISSTKYKIEDVELVNHPIVKYTNEMEINRQWQVNNTSIFKKPDFKGEHCFDTIIVSMTVERRFTFSTYQKSIPVSTLMLLNMLTPFVPPDSGERVTLCITIVLALIFASDFMIDDELPKDSTELSLITVYCVIYNFLSIVTVAWSVLIVCLFRRTGNVPSRLIKILKVNINSITTHSTPDLDQSQDEATSDVSIETRHGDKEDICDVTCSWQDITKKMDKVYFYCFLGTYIGMNGAVVIMYFAMGFL